MSERVSEWVSACVVRVCVVRVCVHLCMHACVSEWVCEWIKKNPSCTMIYCTYSLLHQEWWSFVCSWQAVQQLQYKTLSDHWYWPSVPWENTREIDINNYSPGQDGTVSRSGGLCSYLVVELLLVTTTFTEKSSPMWTLSSNTISKPSTLLDSDFPAACTVWYYSGNLSQHK